MQSLTVSQGFFSKPVKCRSQLCVEEDLSRIELSFCYEETTEGVSGRQFDDDRQSFSLTICLVVHRDGKHTAERTSYTRTGLHVHLPNKINKLNNFHASKVIVRLI